MNVPIAREAMLANGVIQGKPTEAKIRQAWRNLTDDERKECMAKLEGEKDATSVNSGKVQGGAKRTRGAGKSADVSV